MSHCNNEEHDLLLVNNRRLEKENQALKQKLWDAYAMSALGGLVQGMTLDFKEAQSKAFLAGQLADEMLKIRNQRFGGVQ